MDKSFNPKRIYIETLGKPALQTAWQKVIAEKLEIMERSGRLKEGYRKFLIACLKAAGYDSDDENRDGDWGDRKH